MSSLPKWLQKIKNRTDKATEGPWIVVARDGHRTDLGHYHGGGYDLNARLGGGIATSIFEPGADELSQRNKRDLEFAAHARDDVPKLIELVEEMARALEGTEIPLRLASDALYKTDKHDLFRETAQAQFQVRAMLRKYRGEDEDG